MPLFALPASIPDSLANNAQILQSDTAPGALDGFHNDLVEAVVGVRLKTGLSTRQLFASALYALGAYRVQCGAALHTSPSLGVAIVTLSRSTPSELSGSSGSGVSISQTWCRQNAPARQNMSSSPCNPCSNAN